MKAEYIKERDLIHRGLYVVDKQVVWFDAVRHSFYPLGEERWSLGFITRFQRSNEIACQIGKKDDRGFLTIWKNHHVHKIPLTAEILEKNGFKIGYGEHRGNEGLIDDDNKHYYIKVERWDDHKNEVGHCAVWNVCIDQHSPIYVHELQRALICCGLDDLAENFTV